MNKSIAKYEAFRDVIESGKAESIQMLIYNELLKQPQTIVHFRESLQMPHQSCTGAMSMLEDSGFIYKLSTIKLNKRKFTLYNAETDLFKARKRAIEVEMYKRKEWLNRGYKMGWINHDTLQNLLQYKLDI